LPMKLNFPNPNSLEQRDKTEKRDK
jgi:hypothetical protein